ncbi:hypothetical protein BH23GEM3_BH23GEM3_24260 [soil metagenome]
MLTTLSHFRTRSRGSSGLGRSSLRAELLFQLACLGAAAVLLALWTVLLLQLPVFERAGIAWLFLFIGVDLLLFVLLGRYLIDRFVMRPLTATAAAAEAIAGGDHERRVPRAQTREMDALSSSVNRLTDQLLQNQVRLADNVTSLDRTNRLLVDMQRDLVQAEKLAAIGRLAAGVAHEIGNPLGAVLGYSSVLRRRGVDPELVGGIDREARRIDLIIRGLLDYARPVPASEERIDLNESVRGVLALLREQGRLARLEVDLDLAAELPGVAASRHVVDQLWVNLFTNAEAAMQGEGTLRISTRRTHYDAGPMMPVRRADDPPGINYSHLRRAHTPAGQHPSRLEHGTEVLEVTVSDSGPGIAEAHMDKIFDPFFTTKPPGEGTGLGLAIVASTIAELGGRIEIANGEVRGATFVVSFPIQEEAA